MKSATIEKLIESINSYDSTTGIISLNKSYSEQNYQTYTIKYTLVIVTVE